MKLPPFDYACPASIEEAVSILAEHPDGRPLAGGQSLIPMLAFRLAQPSILVDLRRLPGLDRITIDRTGVHLGALVRWRQIEDTVALKAAHPLLFEAVSHIGHYQIRNRGTVGGSLANADPASELPGIAVTCDAVVEVTGASGTRAIPAAELFLGPLTTSLEPSEIITGLRFPSWPRHRRRGFQEFAKHRGDFALAGVAVYYDEHLGAAEGVRIGAIGAASTPRRLRAAEQALEGKAVDERSIAAACTAAASDVDPPDDIHASAEYRCALVSTLLERALRRATAD